MFVGTDFVAVRYRASCPEYNIPLIFLLFTGLAVHAERDAREEPAPFFRYGLMALKAE
jgi:hypothetical protein